MCTRRKKFIAIIGESNAGKSTVISSLTGCGKKCFQGMVTGIIHEGGNDEKIYVITSSPQEERLDKNYDTDIIPFQNILNEVIQENCLGLVMAIQPIKNPIKTLSITQMVQEVQKHREYEPFLFVLNPGYNDRNRSQHIFEIVQNHLRNTGLEELNGRRFAFLNARYINQVSQLYPNSL